MCKPQKLREVLPHPDRMNLLGIHVNLAKAQVVTQSNDELLAVHLAGRTETFHLIKLALFSFVIYLVPFIAPTRSHINTTYLIV